MKILKITIRVILFVVIIAGGVFGAKKFIDSKPKAKFIEPKKTIVPVITTSIKRTNCNIAISAMGTVKAEKTISIFPEVSGKIIKINDNFIDGAFVKENDSLVQINPIDFKILLEQQQSKINQTESDIFLEKGRAAISKEEWILTGLDEEATDFERDLSLRVPQKNKLEATKKLLKSEVRKLELNINRCNIKTPFNAVILDHTVDIGSYVNQQTKIVTLVGTDMFNIEILISEKELSMINIPRINSIGSAVQLNINNSIVTSKITRLLSAVETNGRMIKVIAEVKDPLSLKERKGQPIIMLNKFIKVSIEGTELKNVYKIKREWLRENNSIWQNKNNQLQITTISPIWKDKDFVYFSDELMLENLITSSIPGAIPNMLIKPQSK